MCFILREAAKNWVNSVHIIFDEHMIDWYSWHLLVFLETLFIFRARNTQVINIFETLAIRKYSFPVNASQHIEELAYTLNVCYSLVEWTDEES